MKQQTFNDGIAKIYSVNDISQSGNLPKKALKLKVDSFRYSERIVGMGRFWAAKQDLSIISQIVRVQRNDSVIEHDVVVLKDGKQYDINQIQYVFDVMPPSMDLSLSRIEVAYEII